MYGKRRKFVWALGVTAFFLCGAIFLALEGKGAAAEPVGHCEMHIHKGMECPVCGMYIERYRKTAFKLLFKNGKESYYCGVACGFRDINDHGGLEAVKEGCATDWIRQKPIDFRQATYVIGSDLIPDMIPNILPFASHEEAERFIRKHGGKIESLESLLALISPVGMTVPFRIPPAATPPKNVFAVALGYREIRKDNLISGSSDISYAEAFTSKPMRPKKMTADITFLKMVYGFTDNITLSAVVPRLDKELTIRTKKGGEIKKTRSGIGDIALNVRWRLYHDAYFNKHFGICFGATLPTGDYDKSYPTALQLGKGSVSLTGGAMWSQHIGKFWFHSSLLYIHNFENCDDFQFGDGLKGGVAFHFTPTPDNVVGLELDGSFSERSQLNGEDIHDSGGKHVYATLVTHNRIFLVWGGNLNVRGMFGIPLYEDVKGVQLGEKYHWMVGLTWKRRF